MYAWNWTDVLCPALNCMVNPLIYYWRISGFRSWIKKALLFWKPSSEPKWTSPGSHTYTESYSLSARAGSSKLTTFNKQRTESSLFKQGKLASQNSSNMAVISSLSFTNGSTSARFGHRGSLPTIRTSGRIKAHSANAIDGLHTPKKVESLTIIAKDTDPLSLNSVLIDNQ